MHRYQQEFVANVKKNRIKNGFSQSYFAELCDVATGTIGNIECGIAKPSFDLIIKMSEVFKIHPALLFSENPVEKGIFCPARLNNVLAAFGDDPEFHAELFEQDGFAANPVYKNQNLDIGFELPAEYFSDFFDSGSPRYELGYKYRNKKEYYVL